MTYQRRGHFWDSDGKYDGKFQADDGTKHDSEEAAFAHNRAAKVAMKTVDCRHVNLMRHDYHGETWWQCEEGCDFIFRPKMLAADEMEREQAAQPETFAGHRLVRNQMDDYGRKALAICECCWSEEAATCSAAFDAWLAHARSAK